MKYYTRTEACAFLKSTFGLTVSPKTLGKYATIGGGPKYHKFGNKTVVYDEQELQQWAISRISTPISNSCEVAKYV